MEDLTPEDELELKVAERTAAITKELDDLRKQLHIKTEQERLAQEQLKYIREQRRILRAHVTALRDAADGNYWSWQGDGDDNLETLACPVLITPDDLLKIINGERRE